MPSSHADSRPFAITKHRTRFLGLSWDECIQAFFGGNAVIAVAVITLITFFLLKEGGGFFVMKHRDLVVYRQAGLEYVDILNRQEADHTALTRYLGDLRLRALNEFTQKQGLTLAAATAKLSAFDEFAGKYGDAIDPLRALQGELTEAATAIKTKFNVQADRRVQRQQLRDVGKDAESAAVHIETVNFEQELAPILGSQPLVRQINAELATQLRAALAATPSLPTPELEARMTRFKELTAQYLAGLPAVEAALAAWDFRKPVGWWESLTQFVFGLRWRTASFWQDWYGVVPLLVGSLMVSFVALCLAVPFGVGAAIYMNQFASAREQKVIKPAIEFISAFPSVVLGFFGIAILGETLRHVSQAGWLSWMPGFPIAERLNVLTAGCLLALVAVPTIFTLAEDAINNVPRAVKEASLALGATRLQTTTKVIVPAALSGIVSAVLLGLGRVIGETMIVLLCAGNRIAIPDFTAGLGVFTQPVHTMTGIIAQEMGEVVRGSIHYRALFMVGLVLFVLALVINFLAQKIVRRYRTVSV